MYNLLFCLYLGSSSLISVTKDKWVHLKAKHGYKKFFSRQSIIYYQLSQIKNLTTARSDKYWPFQFLPCLARNWCKWPLWSEVPVFNHIDRLLMTFIVNNSFFLSFFYSGIYHFGQKWRRTYTIRFAILGKSFGIFERLVRSCHQTRCLCRNSFHESHCQVSNYLCHLF